MLYNKKILLLRTVIKIKDVHSQGTLNKQKMFEILENAKL